MYRPILATLVLMVIGGCAHGIERIDGETDPETGNLIAMTLVYSDHEETVQVTESYAIHFTMVGEKRCFYVYDNDAKRISKTSDYDVFIGILKTLPEGVEIQQYGMCSGYSLEVFWSKEEIQGLNSVMESGRRKWAISKVSGLDYTLVCICETIAVRLP